MTTGLPVAKNLIKYNSNSLTENDEEEKVPIDIEFALQKADPEMMKMLLTLDDQVHKMKKRDDITLVNFIENYKSKLIRKDLKNSR